MTRSPQPLDATDVAAASNLILRVAQAVAGGTSHGPFGLASACPWFWRRVWEYLAGRAHAAQMLWFVFMHVSDVKERV